MSTSKHIDVICLVGACLTLLLTMVFVRGEALGLQAASAGFRFFGPVGSGTGGSGSGSGIRRISAGRDPGLRGEGADDTVQTDGAPTPEDGEPTLEDSRVADGAQGQMTDPSGGTDNRNQAGQGQPTQSEGTQPGGSPEDETAVSAERETEILLAASLLCLLIGLAAVSLYPRKH